MSPANLDSELVRRHLLALDQALANLRRYQGRPRHSLDALDEAWVVERGLQICAQNALDIATHLAASAGSDVPDYASAVDELAALGVLPTEFHEHFRGIAGFRNVLVHGYLNVDLDLLHRLLNDHLNDFATFGQLIQAHLDLHPE